MKLNKKDLFCAIILPIIPTVLFLLVMSFFSTNNISKIAESFITFFKQFSLAILSACLTIFSLLQILQSKEWFSKVKKTNAFENLISSFKVCIIFCIIGMFLPFLFELILFNNQRITINCALISISLWTMGFICYEIWTIIKTFIEMLKL